MIFAPARTFAYAPLGILAAGVAFMQRRIALKLNLAGNRQFVTVLGGGWRVANTHIVTIITNAANAGKHGREFSVEHWANVEQFDIA